MSLYMLFLIPCRLSGSPRRFFFSSRRRHTRLVSDWSSDVCSSDLCSTEIDLRNRALIAFTLLTGARDGAIASLKLKHVDIAEGRLVQDAREVLTKRSEERRVGKEGRSRWWAEH